MNDPSKSNPSPSDRLHKGFMTTVKVIQIFGIFFFSIPTLGSVVDSRSTTYTLYGVFVMVSIYLLTQGIIIIVDLVSRIEKNTRYY